VLAAEVFVELAECITAEVEGIVFGIFFPSGLQNSEVFEVFEFTTDSVDLFIYITTELSDEEVFFGIKSMLQEEFFEEFFSTV